MTADLKFSTPSYFLFFGNENTFILHRKPNHAVTLMVGLLQCGSSFRTAASEGILNKQRHYSYLIKHETAIHEF